MNTLLIFFAIPVAIIILSVVLQIQINSPVQVAAIFFAILLVVTFAFFDAVDVFLALALLTFDFELTFFDVFFFKDLVSVLIFAITLYYLP